MTLALADFSQNPIKIDRRVSLCYIRSIAFVVAAADLPKTWVQPCDTYSEHTLTPGSAEYNAVVQNFNRTIGGNQTEILEVSKFARHNFLIKNENNCVVCTHKYLFHEIIFVAGSHVFIYTHIRNVIYFQQLIDKESTESDTVSAVCYHEKRCR